MVTQKLNNLYENYFLGGYISNLIDNPDKPYLSIAMKSYDREKSKTVFIMIFKSTRKATALIVDQDKRHFIRVIVDGH